MKAQVLANFVTECTIINDKPEQQEFDDNLGMAEGSNAKLDSTWILHVDGVSNSYESGAGLILINFEGTVTEYALQFNFKALNNQIEYEALLVGLKIAKKLGINNLKVFTDSQLITRQVKA